jgi:hypothetical protein
MRQIAAKRDSNEPDIVQALRGHGASVTPLSVGGIPDLLVGYKGVNLLFEVKSDKGVLTKEQKEWHGHWSGQKKIVRSPEEALIYLYAIDYLIRS